MNKDEGTTHYEGCYDGGPRHYECALLKIKQLVTPMMEFKTPTKIFGPNLKWVDLTVDEATIIWERVDERDGWELIMQVQRALKGKNT